MRRCLNAVLPILLPTVLAGQATRGSAPTAATIQFVRYADIFGGRLVAAFNEIPAAQYQYRPAKTEQTVGFIAQHLEDANYKLCEKIGRTTHPRTSKDALTDTLKARWPKDTLVARLDKSLQFCDDVLERVGQLDTASEVSELLAFETDLAEHYSQLSVYMRLLGLVPPSALPPTPRTAIDLPVAALSKFVGTYEVVPGFDFIVSMRDGALSVRSAPGGSDVRLWPESAVEFFVKEVDAQVTFERNAQGATGEGLVIEQFGRRRFATKIR